MTLKVKFTAALYDSSGYSEASRNYLCSLDTLVRAGLIELCASSPKFELWHTSIGGYKPLVDHYCAKEFKPDVHIVHLTPDCYDRYIDKGVYTICYAAWETTILPEKWVAKINQMNECWVPSQFNVEVFKNSGVKIPVYAIPHAMNVDDFITRADAGEQMDFNIPKDRYAFYSIFQWTERKNPIGLLRAYFAEFKATDPVVLVIKSYMKSHGASERDFIRAEIQRVRESMFIKDGAPVVYIGGDLSSAQIAQLHKRGDCLVFPTRAEGWGLPLSEAMCFGKPTITPNFGGHLDFANEQNSYLTKYGMTNCCFMPWGLYHGRMWWAEPDIQDTARMMRHVFNNQEEAKQKGLRAAADMRQFSWEKVGQMMWGRIKAAKGVG